MSGYEQRWIASGSTHQQPSTASRTSGLETKNTEAGDSRFLPRAPARRLLPALRYFIERFSQGPRVAMRRALTATCPSPYPVDDRRTSAWVCKRTDDVSGPCQAATARDCPWCGDEAAAPRCCVGANVSVSSPLESRNDLKIRNSLRRSAARAVRLDHGIRPDRAQSCPFI